MMPAIVGFMPWADRRLSILNRSGKAAKVVPNPATKPTTSDRLSVGSSRLAMSVMPRPSQPLRIVVLNTSRAYVAILERAMCSVSLGEGEGGGVPRRHIQIQPACQQVIPIAIVAGPAQQIAQPPTAIRQLGEWEPHIALAVMRRVVDGDEHACT